MGLSLTDPENFDLWRRLNAAQCRQTDRDFSRGLGRGCVEEQGAARNLRTLRMVSAPDPQTLAEINQRIEEIIDLMTGASGEEGEMIALSLVMAPVGGDE